MTVYRAIESNPIQSDRCWSDKKPKRIKISGVDGGRRRIPWRFRFVCVSLKIFFCCFVCFGFLKHHVERSLGHRNILQGLFMLRTEAPKRALRCESLPEASTPTSGFTLMMYKHRRFVMQQAFEWDLSKWRRRSGRLKEKIWRISWVSRCAVEFEIKGEGKQREKKKVEFYS